MAVGTAEAAGPDGRTLERERRYAEALAAYRGCVAEGGADARYCDARAAELAPQAADGFAGWAVLDGVRQDYRALGAEEAARRVTDALAAHPDSPAAPAMRLWLASQLTHAAPASADAAAARDAARADPGVSTAARALLDAADARVARRQRQGRVAAGLAGLAALYAGVAARGFVAGRRPPEPRVLAVGTLLLAVVPAAMAWLWGEPGWPWFLASGAAAVGGAALATAAPLWLAVPGSAALVGLTAWAAGWFDSLGVA